MKFYFVMQDDLVVSCASGSDDIPYDAGNGLEVKNVSFENYLKYNDVMNSNGLLCLKYYASIDTFNVVSTPDNPAIIDKTYITANDIDTATISELLNPSYISIATIGSYEVTDGIFEFSVDTPGAYIIKCLSPNYREKEFTVNAS